MSELLENIYQLKYSGEQVDELLDTVSQVPNLEQFQNDVNASLRTKVSRKVITARLPASIASDGWQSEDGILIYNVEALGATTETTPHIVPINIYPMDYNSKMAAWNKITRAVAYSNIITFYCYDGAPGTSIDVQIEYFLTE